MEKFAILFVQFRSSPQRALLVEAACLAPAFALLAVGGFEWGGYFWLQHRVQAAADSALAAAVASPSPENRQALARRSAERTLSAHVADLTLEGGMEGPTLQLAYDASASPVFALSRIIPLPPSIIVRRAARP